MRFARFVDVWYRNMWRYARKWMRPGQAEALRWGIIVGMMLRVLGGLRRPAAARRRAAGGVPRVRGRAEEGVRSMGTSSSPIVLVTWNSAPYLRRCLDGIRQQTHRDAS